MNICNQCKSYKRVPVTQDNDVFFDTCTLVAPTFDKVTGLRFIRNEICQVQRLDLPNDPTLCGSDGKHFEKRRKNAKEVS